MVNQAVAIDAEYWIKNHSKNKEAIAAAFSKAAHTYDRSAEFQRQVADHLMSYLPIKLDGVRVLDIGCGTGYCSEQLLNRGATVVAFDLAHAMLVKAKERCGDYNISYVQGDAEDLPFDVNEFDVVISSLALQWCQDLSVPLAEMKRVTENKGKVIFSTLLDGSLFELKKAWSKVDIYQHVNEFITLSAVNLALAQSENHSYQLDCIPVEMMYSSATALMKDLKGIGATHLPSGRQSGLLSKQKLLAVEEAYQMFKNEFNRLPATYQVGYGVIRND
ncbi:malonyl-[acyl-carrier protein] O-methyltransferase BioC [Aliivibrio salmonicida]|uniref:Malonyl-[acyl-carrier protein] O-methyltransferase n=1 Tax=Aliivibrio salmonicida (strain LFI1238) TaxID=316275 RepID=B6ESC5_ALISL|nr:malonyl-ACP O-methyltransferase BioC [Aliivibrio salmonicida]AZL86928.1 malonyl-[acyl-carrier protein] O-methyltransferase BioC [Aliivibrio salmonicida]CAQ81612.1 biotin synthesis protein BioC [Aliivibrio salmonicida LFI1238]